MGYSNQIVQYHVVNQVSNWWNDSHLAEQKNPLLRFVDSLYSTGGVGKCPRSTLLDAVVDRLIESTSPP
jgi:hypothetical protein